MASIGWMELKIEIEQYFSNHLFNLVQGSRFKVHGHSIDVMRPTFFLATHHFPSLQITSLERVIKL